MVPRRRRILKAVRLAVLTEASYRCAVPTCRMILAIDLHHLVWVSEGGPDDAANLLALCPTCHALHHRGEIPRDALLIWKRTLADRMARSDDESATRPAVVRGAGGVQCDERPATVGNLDHSRLAASAIERVRHDNVHGRVCLAICGSWSNTDAPAGLIDGLVDGLARMLAEHPLHVIHGPRGVGIEVVNRAVNDYQASTLTFTLKVGPQIQIVAPAEYVLFVGGLRRTRIEVRLALEQGKNIIPVAATGGAARECYDRLIARSGGGLARAAPLAVLGSSSDPIVLCQVIREILRRA